MGYALPLRLVSGLLATQLTFLTPTMHGIAPQTIGFRECNVTKNCVLTDFTVVFSPKSFVRERERNCGLVEFVCSVARRSGFILFETLCTTFKDFWWQLLFRIICVWLLVRFVLFKLCGGFVVKKKPGDASIPWTQNADSSHPGRRFPLIRRDAGFLLMQGINREINVALLRKIRMSSVRVHKAR